MSYILSDAVAKQSCLLGGIPSQPELLGCSVGCRHLPKEDTLRREIKGQMDLTQSSPLDAGHSLISGFSAVSRRGVAPTSWGQGEVRINALVETPECGCIKLTTPSRLVLPSRGSMQQRGRGELREKAETLSACLAAFPNSEQKLLSSQAGTVTSDHRHWTQRTFNLSQRSLLLRKWNLRPHSEHHQRCCLWHVGPGPVHS